MVAECPATTSYFLQLYSFIMRNGVLALFSMILGLLLPSNVYGQECELKLHGQVVQSENNQPLAYAKV